MPMASLHDRLAMPRRTALRLSGLAPVLAAAPAWARAAFVGPADVVVFCDPELRGVVRRLGVLFSSRDNVPVRLQCAPARLLAAQLVRHERCDIIVTLSGVVERLAADGTVHPQTSVGAWRNRLLIARSGPGPAPMPVRPALVSTLLAGRMLGAPDPGPNAVVDTQALIGRLGLNEALVGHVMGEVDMEGVAWLLARGRVGLGLLLSTELPGRGFSAAVSIPDAAYPPIRTAAAFNRHVLSRHAAAFMRFLTTNKAHRSLAESGLEVEA